MMILSTARAAIFATNTNAKNKIIIRHNDGSTKLKQTIRYIAKFGNIDSA